MHEQLEDDCPFKVMVKSSASAILRYQHPNPPPNFKRMNPKQLDFSKMFLKPERQTMKILLGVDMMWVVGSEKEFKFANLGGTTMDRTRVRLSVPLRPRTAAL